ASAIPWEPARQSRAVTAESDFQIERETVRGSVWDFSQALAFLLLRRFLLLGPSQFFLELATPSSSELIFSLRLLPFALGSVICSALAPRCDSSYAVFLVILHACLPHRC